jgi:hypothetical protein
MDMTKYISRLHILAVLALIVGSPLAAADGDVEGQAPGWYYLWAQCVQEPSTWDDPALCSMGVEGESYQALAISSVFNQQGDDRQAYETFEAEASRRFGFEVQATDVGPFASFAEAEQAIVESLRFSRMLQKGKLAVTAIALEPERLDDEPNDEERLAEPGPLPPVMESFKGGSATVWGDEDAKACGLRRADRTEIIPSLVTNLWGEDGEGCPRKLQEGYGIYLFDVERNGAICGETGVCTELYDDDGHQIGVIEETPYPMISRDLLGVWGIIRSGQWNEYLYSIPERRLLYDRWPGTNGESKGRLIIGPRVIIDDRPAIEIYREYRDREPEITHFWLDTMTFDEGLNPVETNAIRTAEQVCLSPRSSVVDDRDGPCTKARIMLESAGLQDTLIYARVRMDLGDIWAQRGATEVAIGHYQAAIAFALSRSIEKGEVFEELAYLEWGSAGFCSRSPEAQMAMMIAELRQTWQAVDDLAAASTAGFTPGLDGEAKAVALADLNFAARRIMVLLGGLFPQFNRPMDVPLLVNRLTSRSVPAYDEDNPNPLIGVMEALFSAGSENGAIAAMFIEALGNLEDATLVSDEIENTADMPAIIADFTKTQASFGPVIDRVLASEHLDRALKRTVLSACPAVSENRR